MIPIPVVPVIVVVLGCGAYFRNRASNRGVMTPERQKIFQAALAGGMQDPGNLEKLAEQFESQGLPDQGSLLRQRAALRRLPNEVKLARRKVWRKAIKSKKRDVMMQLADAYDREGCTSAAMRLREIISGLPETIPESTAVEPSVGDTPPDAIAGEETAEDPQASSETDPVL